MDGDRRDRAYRAAAHITRERLRRDAPERAGGACSGLVASPHPLATPAARLLDVGPGAQGAAGQRRVAAALADRLVGELEVGAREAPDLVGLHEPVVTHAAPPGAAGASVRRRAAVALA